MAIDIVLLLCGMVCMLVGMLGCVLPVLPGIPLCYVAILLLEWSSISDFSWLFLVGWGIVVVLVQLLDVFVPVWGTKRFGGGRLGAWGCAIGTVVGMLFFPPWGLLFGPFLGAVAGELIANKKMEEALRAGFGSFLGFLAGTLMKLCVAAALAFFFFKDFISYIWAFATR